MPVSANGAATFTAAQGSLTTLVSLTVAAAGLTIEGELKNGEKSEETSDVTMTYIPSQSTRRGGLIFTKNPNEYQLQIRAKGYEQP